MEDEFRVLLTEYLQESHERLDAIEDLLQQFAHDGSREILAEIKRELHTLKGNSGMMGLSSLQEAAHHLEESLPSLHPGDPTLVDVLSRIDSFRDELLSIADHGTKSPLDSLRVSFTLAEELGDSITQMIIARNQFQMIFERMRAAHPHDEVVQAFESPMQTISDLIASMRIGILAMRLVPLQRLARQLTRIIRDEQDREKKRVRFVTEGLDGKVERTIFAGLTDALGHLVRNSVIHGIESADARMQMKKPSVGTIRFTATVKQHAVEITLSDDGRGIDTAALRAAAVTRGFDPASFRNDMELMFLPDVSTRNSTSLGAGRGIGMSAVVQTIQRLGGTMHVASERGKGTSFAITLPVDVAIQQALLISVDGETCAIPASAVVEVLPFQAGGVERIGGTPYLAWRSEHLTIADLGVLHGSRLSVRDEGVAIILRVDSFHGAVISDSVLGIAEIVARPVDAIAPIRPTVSGATILADGTLALVMDPRRMFDVRSPLVM